MATAESLLAAGRLPEARRIAERLHDARPNDADVLILLGRIHLAWPTVGRYAAESLFARAGALRPGDPEPHYWLGHVGFALRGDDGEWIARRGLDRVLELNPDFRDAWALWLQLYRDDDDRRRAVAVLARRAGDYRNDLRRAQLLIELGDQAAAEPLLRSLVRERQDDVAPRALLARTLFAARRDDEGAAEYEAALRLAATDTADVLWRQVRGIASPAERSAWAATPPQERPAFLRLFWSRRRPDLQQPVNTRIGEHFRRTAEVARAFDLQHPNSLWFHSARYRAFTAGASAQSPEGSGARRGLSAEAGDWCAPNVTPPPDAWAATADADPRTPDESVNLEDRLDDRGRIFLRHGRPDGTFVVPGREGRPPLGEIWCYRRGADVFRVSFIPGGSWYLLGGAPRVTPVRSGEGASAAALLATDAPSPRGPLLPFSFWTAAFKGQGPRQTELVLILDPLSGVAELVDGAGVTAARAAGNRVPLRLSATPGRYALLIDGTRGDSVGLYRGTIAVPDHDGEALSVSGLLIAEGAVPPDRDAILARAPTDLRLPAGRPMRLYAEVYGLGQRDNGAHYEARYRVERTDGGFLRGGGRRERVTTIAFRREVPYTPRVVETLVLDPDRLPRGRYRLVLEIADEVHDRTASSASIEFELR